jgi:hypothetical protein
MCSCVLRSRPLGDVGVRSNAPARTAGQMPWKTILSWASSITAAGAAARSAGLCSFVCRMYYACCSGSLHFVGLAISDCLLPSSPRPSCTADSSAALTATAPVPSLVHAWPCSSPLQPLPTLPFPAPPLLVIFCAHLTFHHSLSCLISYFPPGFPYAFLTGLCPFWHIFCLHTGFEHLPLVRLPCWRYRRKRLILFFPRSPRTLQSDYFAILLHVTCAEYPNSSRARTDNRMNTVPQLYSIDLGTFRVALLVCYPQRC